MDEARNPFQLEADDRVEPFGRVRELETIDAMLERLAAGRAATPVLLAGRSGAGCSTLLRAAEHRADAHDWHYGAASVAHDEPLRDAVARAIAAALTVFAARRPGAAGLRTAVDAVAGFAPSAIDDLPIAVSHDALAVPRGDLSRDLRRLLLEIADGLRDLVGRGVLVAIDDLHRADPADAVATLRVFAEVMQDGQPVGLVAAGTPTLRWFAVSADLAPALVDVGPLAASDVAVLVTERVRAAGAEATAAAAGAVARSTAGYPALVVLYAHAAWNAAGGDVLDEPSVSAGAPAARDLLANLVLAPALAVPAAARRYLRAVAEADDPADSAEVARRLGDTTRFGSGASQLTILRDDLVRAGILATVDGTHLAFAHPAARSYVLSWE